MNITARELLVRYARSCELKQGFDWQKIVTCFQRWTAGTSMGSPAILPVERSEQLIQAAIASPRKDYSGNVIELWEAEMVNEATVIHKRSACMPARIAFHAYAKRHILGNGKSWSFTDISWTCLPAIGAVELNLSLQFAIWYPLFEAFEAGAFCFFITDQGIEVCPPPTEVKLDDQGVVHSATGPALEWLSDIRAYFWKGIVVEPHVVLNPECITEPEIDAEIDVNVRRIKIERSEAANPVRYTPPTVSVTVEELKERFLRGCELKHPVNWGKIKECFRRWMEAMRIDPAAVIPIEDRQQYLKALKSSADAEKLSSSKEPGAASSTWAARAMRKTRFALGAKPAGNFLKRSPIADAARAASHRFPTWPTSFAQLPANVDSSAARHAGWTFLTAIGALERGDLKEFSKWYPLLEVFEAGAGLFCFTDQGIEVCPIPAQVKVDNSNLLHSEAGPAFVWLTGIRDYYWHGLRVEPYVVDHPELITIADIESEPTSEIRQIKIERWSGANPARDKSLIRTLTAVELKERYLRACQFKQAVEWDRIENYFRRWASALGMGDPIIWRVEQSAQLLPIAKDALAARTKGYSPDAIARSASGNHTWLQEALHLDRQAAAVKTWLKHGKGQMSPSKIATLLNQIEQLEGWADQARKMSANSPAIAAQTAHESLVANIVEAARRLCAVPVEPVVHVPFRGSAVADMAWDVTSKGIIAINALERNIQGDQFTQWYHMFKAFEAGAFSIFITEKGIYISPIPSLVKLNDRGRLHSPSGPAFVWLDDISHYYWHGVRVEPYVVDNPDRITVPDIDAEPNAEVRRVKMERFGMGNYLSASGAQEIHRDDFGILYQMNIPGGEPFVAVKVANATAEPDGSFKDYFLRVPPTIRTARAAVAWTFWKSAFDYDPSMQT